MSHLTIGALVTCRERDWVILPSERDDILILRPLSGSETEQCGVYLPIEGHRISPATFPVPDPSRNGDFVSGALLRDAVRLTLRNGAGPFRSLGRISVRPRPYQLVPLLMALRLHPVRLLIADDVGVGKTIEAGLVVRELLDRGEIRRLSVLCPPHLCDQWQRELREKFAIDAVVVRSNTIGRLERGLPPGDLSIFDHYPFTVASIDYVKSARHRDAYLRACPSCVIVDEAHTATHPRDQGTAQQQRYELVREIANNEQRHLLLLTATPHSGIEDSFRSLLGVLHPSFATFDLAHLRETERDTLAQHMVQRRRADVMHWLGEETPFPTRHEAEVAYPLPRATPYRQLFDDVYAFARERIREQEYTTPVFRQRVRYWAALSLLRCVMSSPAAAEKALRARASSAMTTPHPDTSPAVSLFDGDETALDDLLSTYVYETTDQEGVQDTEPSHLVEQESTNNERARLRRFAARAAALVGAHDPKAQAALTLVEKLLDDGYSPILYCRYIATATYLADHIRTHLLDRYGQSLRVLSVTGERSEEERETLVAELSESPRRVLVATDCLSEGINLQHAFDAVVHYDLPWNPNRLEQREGRVDRYGQRKATIRTALLMSHDNPMDEAVLNVLLRKAMTIHRTLGISVPLPSSSKEVLDTLIGNLFQPAAEQHSFLEHPHQTHLGDADALQRALVAQWDHAVDRERESRTRFAQRRIKPDEVARELEESDAVLGSPATVEQFVRQACERFGAPLIPEAAPDGIRYHLPFSHLPERIRERTTHAFAPHPGTAPPDNSAITFRSPAPDGVISIGRNHPLTIALAEELLEGALTADDALPTAARCSLIRSGAVQQRTTLLLLRVRMLIEQTTPPAPTLLAEELIIAAYQGRPGSLTWLDEDAAHDLLTCARPDANVQPDERIAGLQRAMQQVQQMTDDINQITSTRAERLRASHQRVRRATGGGSVRVRPHLPPDILGVYVLLPLIREERTP